MNRFICCVLLVCSSTAQSQTCNPNIVRTAPDSRYELVVGSGGSEVLDKKTGLIWQRCSLGQTWSGTSCVGTPSRYKWTDALVKAKAVGNGYRLPNVKELQSLIERACEEPALNKSMFVNTPTSEWYWSSSPVTGSSNYVWFMDFEYGDSSYSFLNKNDSNYVRAVRAGQ